MLILVKGKMQDTLVRHPANIYRVIDTTEKFYVIESVPQTTLGSNWYVADFNTATGKGKVRKDDVLAENITLEQYQTYRVVYSASVEKLRGLVDRNRKELQKQIEGVLGKALL